MKSEEEWEGVLAEAYKIFLKRGRATRRSLMTSEVMTVFAIYVCSAYQIRVKMGRTRAWGAPRQHSAAYPDISHRGAGAHTARYAVAGQVRDYHRAPRARMA